MHTSQQLRAALHDLADAMPGTAELPGGSDELLPAAKRSTRRSFVVKLGAPALAGAMVAGVVVAAVALSSGSHRAALPGNAPTSNRAVTPATGTSVKGSPLLTTTFDVEARSGMTVGGPSIDADSQDRYLSWDGFRTDSNNQAIVRVWTAGRWTPTRPADAQDVMINGKAGFYGKLTSQWMPAGGGTQSGLAWEYAPGAWATVMRSKTTSKADLVSLANAVRTGLQIPVRVPFRLSGLPAGGKLTGIGCSWGPSQGKGCDLDFAYPGGRVSLTVDNAKWTDGGTPTTIGGRPAWESLGTVAVAGPGVSEAWINTTKADHSLTDSVLSKAELRSIMAGLTFASNVKDPSTWVDATTALP